MDETFLGIHKRKKTPVLPFSLLIFPLRFPQAGYREGITAGKESALQEGFNEGFALTGVPIGRELGLARGILSALLLSPLLNTLPSDSDTADQIKSETQEINAHLSRITFADLMPPDLEAEEHARQHREEEGGGSGTREMAVLEDMMEQMDTGSEMANGQVRRPARDRSTAEDLKALRNQLDRLTARLGMNLNC
jgi:hypothetical protein